jgi:hypothetical protein
MKVDSKLLKRLEALDNPNQILAEALGLCPTCGQELPSEERRQRTGDKRAAILAWRVEHPGESQSACARALGVSQTYVSKLWLEQDDDADTNSPQGDANG